MAEAQAPFDPSKCRVLLVGKLLTRLAPFLQSKGYARVDHEESGSKAVELLAGASYHLVLLELNLRDIELRDFFMAARGKQRDASFILMAPPTEAEMVVSALVLGADAYVPLPPDEDELFQVLERHGVAALQRKNQNPEPQPGVAENTRKLEEALATARAQISDLEEQNRLFEAEAARLNKLLDAAKQEAATKPAAAAVPAGHEVVASARLEELESKATFSEFLESENDEIKKERDALLEKLKELGLGDDVPAGVADEFDEPTGAVHIDESGLIDAAELTRGLPVSGIVAAVDDDADGDDDDDELLIMDDDSEEIDLAAVAELAATSPAVNDEPSETRAGAPAAALNGEDHDDEGGLALEDLLDDEDSDEIDLAALEAMVAKSAPKPMSAARAAPAPVPSAAPKVAPAAAPPPSSDDDDGDGDADDFEDINTDALLRLADMASGEEGPSPQDLEELLAAIDED